MENDIIKKTYEITYIVLDENISSLEPSLRKHGVDMKNDENRLAKVRLEFPIKKQGYGFFGVLVFEAAPDKISPLESDLRLSDRILRFMITIYQPPKKEPEKKLAKSFGTGFERGIFLSSEDREKKASEKSLKKEKSLNEDGGDIDDVLRDIETVVSSSLTNEDLERKIEEILQ